MRTYERSTHTAALTSVAAAPAISGTDNDRHSGLVWVALRVSNLPLAKIKFAEVLHTQPATAALTPLLLLHMFLCPS